MWVFTAGTGFAQRTAESSENTETLAEVKKSAVSGYVNTNGHFRLAIDNPERLKYKIVVLDDKGKVWYEETTNSGRFRRIMDVTYPPAERLKVEVKGGDEVVSYVVERKEAMYSIAKQEVL